MAGSSQPPRFSNRARSSGDFSPTVYLYDDISVIKGVDRRAICCLGQIPQVHGSLL